MIKMRGVLGVRLVFGVLMALMALGASMTGCSEDGGDPEARGSADQKAVIQVRGQGISKVRFDRSYKVALARLAKVPPIEGVTRRHLRYRAKQVVLSSVIWGEWMEQEAERKDVTAPPGARGSEKRAQALERGLLATGPVDPTPSTGEIAAFYRKNQIDVPLSAAAPEIRATLEDRRTNKAERWLMAALYKAYRPQTDCTSGYDIVEQCAVRAKGDAPD